MLSPLLMTIVWLCFVVSRSKSFMFCGLYAALIFGGQHFMRERPKLNLRKPLVLWSLSLAIFRWAGDTEKEQLLLRFQIPQIQKKLHCMQKRIWNVTMCSSGLCCSSLLEHDCCGFCCRLECNLTARHVGSDTWAVACKAFWKRQPLFNIKREESSLLPLYLQTWQQQKTTWDDKLNNWRAKIRRGNWTIVNSHKGS